jgi:hypothetical protein
MSRPLPILTDGLKDGGSALQFVWTTTFTV